MKVAGFIAFAALLISPASPAAVCAHGGGGTAFPDWVREWNKHGYAAIAMDLEGHLPGGRFTGSHSRL